MARSSTTFKKGTAPKGRTGKNKATLAKEAIGLTGWDRLTEFLLNEGAEKMIANMGGLKPAQYAIAFQALAEFVKPKLSRAEHTGKDGKDLIPNEINHNINFK